MKTAQESYDEAMEFRYKNTGREFSLIESKIRESTKKGELYCIMGYKISESAEFKLKALKYLVQDDKYATKISWDISTPKLHL